MSKIVNFDLFNPTEEHALLRKTVREFVLREVEPQALKHDREERFNLPLFRKLGPLGLLGITVPEKYGGSGMDPLAAVIVHEEISASDPGFCLAYLAHSMLCCNNLAINGSEDLKMRLLPALCSGAKVGAMAMSEPDTGTDVLAMKTVATQTSTGFVLNGRKMWITNGTIDDNRTPCDCVLVYTRVAEDKDRRSALSAFLVENSHKGFTVGQKIYDKAGMRASNTAELCFDNCLVPTSNLIGKVGDAISSMMRNLEIERVALAAMSLGIAKRSLEIMVRYANERTAFGKRIALFGQIQKYIADSFAEYQAARAYVYNVARQLCLTKAEQRLNSDGVKLFAARVGKEIADRAIQVLGGYGYVGEYIVERLWRDAKLLEIGGGTMEAHEKNISQDLARNPNVLV